MKVEGSRVVSERLVVGGVAGVVTSRLWRSGTTGDPHHSSVPIPLSPPPWDTNLTNTTDTVPLPPRFDPFSCPEGKTPLIPETRNTPPSRIVSLIRDTIPCPLDPTLPIPKGPPTGPGRR